MIKTLLLIISVFAVVFLEHLLLKTVHLSLFALLGIYMWDKSGKFSYLLFFVVVSIILDVTMHFPLGLHIFALSIPLLFLWIAKLFIPTDSSIQESIILFVATFLFYTVFLILQSLLLDSVVPAISLTTVLYSLIKSLVSVIVYLVITLSTQTFRSRELEKIRLR